MCVYVYACVCLIQYEQGGETYKIYSGLLMKRNQRAGWVSAEREREGEGTQNK